MIESLRMKNFRKHADLTLDFDEKFNLIHGRNNAGKTTVFYAIEYCLFGNVNGFKAIGQLAKFKSKNVGVEIIFRGRDNNKYKLQRIHELKVSKRTKKSKKSVESLNATGYYTLKKIIKNGLDNEEEKTGETDLSEAYILSSDFGNREEELRLKIGEITGITKRFFETGIHFYQGSISEILQGSKKLDIVFGITATTSIMDVFRSQALDYEKESSGIDVLKVKIDNSRKEKKKLEDMKKTQEEKTQELENKISNASNELNLIGGVQSSSNRTSELIQNYETKSKQVDEFSIKLKDCNEQFDAKLKEFGDIASLEDKLSKNEKISLQIKEKIKESEESIEKSSDEKNKMEKDQYDLQNKLSSLTELLTEFKNFTEIVGDRNKIENSIKDNQKKSDDIKKLITKLQNDLEENDKKIIELEREKGDKEGILERRNQTKTSPTCEYCGASIDPSKIENEIIELQSKLSSIENDVKEIQEEKEKISKSLGEAHENDKTSSSISIQLKGNLEKINDLENHLQKYPPQTELDQKLFENKEKLIDLSNKTTSEKENLETLRNSERKNHEEKIKNETAMSDLKKLDEKRNALEESLKTFSEEIIAEYKNAKESYQKMLEKVKKQKSEHLQKINEDFITFQTDSELNSGSDNLKNIRNVIEKNKVEENTSEENASEGKDQYNQNEIIETIKIDHNKLRELLLSSGTEISTKLEMFQQQLDEFEAESKNISNEIMNIEKDIAVNEKEIGVLSKKNQLAEKYRKYQKIFDEIQDKIRENVAKSLETKILDFHQKLSCDDEFDSVQIDNTDYSLFVKPKENDIDEPIAAAVYQGGGHKLILGLAYKLALGDLLGDPPFLLVDEPTEFMDQNNRINLLSNLSSILNSSQLLLITHQDVDKIPATKKIEILKN